MAAIYASQDDPVPLGAAVVIDKDRVLTCAHVVTSEEGTILDGLWVGFPKADQAANRRQLVASVAVPGSSADTLDDHARGRDDDIAVLVLAGRVPPGVSAAPLKCPRSNDLVGRRWWAFGFPANRRRGSTADGVVGAALTLGWIRIDTESRYQVEEGFSGGGLWSPDYQAVVAVVGEVDERGNGQAITLHQADALLPGQDLRQLAERWLGTAADDTAAAWHWELRVRGVSVGSERGYRFRGRTTALREITRWLDRRDLVRRALVVTGSPGAGKSAVLSRIVTTADPDAAAMLPSGDKAVRASPGSVAVAVYAKGKTALEVATEVARAASAGLPERMEEFSPALRSALAGRDGRFNVIIDALDEAASPAQAKMIITDIIVPLVETCTDVGVRVVAGSRRADGDGDMLAAFGRSLEVVDLDDPQYFSVEDLAAYALAVLQLAGDEPHGNPYTDDDSAAAAVARRIAEMSDQNFLIAGLTARVHGLHDTRITDPAELSFTSTVDDAMRGYLRHVAPVGDLPAEAVLTALAFAEAPGMPLTLWQASIEVCGAGKLTTAQLAQFAQSSAATFLVESSGYGQAPVFRLFHQALNDALLRARSRIIAPADDERALTRGFISLGRQCGWDRAPRYLLRSLALHAGRADMIDDLLADDSYLLYADLPRLTAVADRATTRTGQDTARLLRLTPHTADVQTDERAAMFSITSALENLGNRFQTSLPNMPYRARWAAATSRIERWVLESQVGWVCAVCQVQTAGGEVLLAGGTNIGTIQLWDPLTGLRVADLDGHADKVRSVCQVEAGGEVLLASASDDCTVRLWDPVSGQARGVLKGHRGMVRSVCQVEAGGEVLLASASDDCTVRLWDPVLRAGPRRAERS